MKCRRMYTIEPACPLFRSCPHFTVCEASEQRTLIEWPLIETCFSESDRVKDVAMFHHVQEYTWLLQELVNILFTRYNT